MSHLRPSTLNANQAAFLAPFPQALAQNLALLMFNDAKGQDKKIFFLLEVKSRDVIFNDIFNDIILSTLLSI